MLVVHIWRRYFSMLPLLYFHPSLGYSRNLNLLLPKKKKIYDLFKVTKFAHFDTQINIRISLPISPLFAVAYFRGFLWDYGVDFRTRICLLQFAQKICPDRDRDVGLPSSWMYSCVRDRWLHSGSFLGFVFWVKIYLRFAFFSQPHRPELHANIWWSVGCMQNMFANFLSVIFSRPPRWGGKDLFYFLLAFVRMVIIRRNVL